MTYSTQCSEYETNNQHIKTELHCLEIRDKITTGGFCINTKAKGIKEHNDSFSKDGTHG